MSVTVQAIAQNPSTILKDVNGYLVPNILSFSLKKTPEDRPPAKQTDDTVGRQNGDSIETDEETRMSPRRKGNIKGRHQTSSFLLDPFLKPVATQIESNKENPVLKALFGETKPSNLASWTYVTKTPVNNCHPFKKTEFSHDLNTDDLPVQVPKSLLKKPSKVRKTSIRRETTPEPKTNNVKTLQNPRSSVSSTSTISLIDSTSHSDRQPKETNEKALLEELKSAPPSEQLPNKKKKIFSQMNLQTNRGRGLQINVDRLMQLRTLVDNAVKNHKVYSMTGCYNSVRNALKQRGWIEKIDSDVKGRRKINKFEDISIYDAAFQFVQKYQTVPAMRLSMQMNSGFINNDQIHYTGQGEAEIMNRMLRNVTEDLCWLSRPYPYYCLKDFDKYEMVNRLPRAFFSNKVGLCNSLQQIQWFYENGVCSTQFPRTYNVSTKDEIDAFKEDYRLTACINVLKWFIQAYRTGGEKAVRSPDGKVDMNVIEFALRRCAEFVKTKQHEDIDIIDTPVVWEYQWDTFISQYYKIINEGQILRESKEGVLVKAILSNVQSMLTILKQFWPQFDIDGYQNFWIVKPGGRCCGAGIVIKNNLEQILTMVNPSSLKETRFVVQKYIERPLLIYNTKFDIRQWFLVTNVYPLTVWMYRECYLRFCSQPFTLRNTHESIHLCNNAVQRKYKNGKRDKGLPDENMWDSYTFQTYLKSIGHPEAWEKYIYPGMREGFIGALLASQESMERKKNCFELYGADFMISDTLTDGPWLIEINSNPAMDASTSVTARMCPQVLEDIIKVVIDRRDNKAAPTGAFEMVFRQNCPPVPPYLGMSLCVKGEKAYKSNGDCKMFSKKSKSKQSTESLHYTDTEEESTVEEIISASNTSTSEETLKEDTQAPIEDKLSKKDIEDKNEKKERGVKRRKVDWVKKNIENLRSFHSFKQPKSPQPPESNRSSPINTKPTNSFKEHVLEMLNSAEMKEIFQEILTFKKENNEVTKNDQDEDCLMIDGLEVLRKKSDGSLEDVTANVKIPEKSKQTIMILLEICRRRADGEKINWESAFKETTSYTSFLAKNAIKSCPDFDAAFETELRNIDDKSIKSKSTESIESFTTAQSRLSLTNSKTSLDYFRDWKAKISETRRTCEDMLAELQFFNEENSKVKFNDAVKKRFKDEVDFVKRIKHYRKCKKLGRGKTKKEEGRDASKTEGNRSKYWDYGADDGVVPLAINSETGAVRSINNSLPKIKQRSRPLLPNGTSGHGRKIDLSLEQTCSH